MSVNRNFNNLVDDGSGAVAVVTATVMALDADATRRQTAVVARPTPATRARRR